MATTEVTSPEQFSGILKSTPIIVANFYANRHAASKQTIPMFQKLARGLSRPGVAAFVTINVEGEQAKPLATEYGVSSLPTFVVFRNSQVAEKIVGADPVKLQSVIEKLGSDVESAQSSGGSYSGSGMTWRGADLPPRYTDITDSILEKQVELLNVENGFSVESLISKDKPSALSKGKEPAGAKDWVESDTDEQLLLYVEFKSTVKLHTIQITSLSKPPQEDEEEDSDEEDDDELPMRPKTIKLFVNPPHNIGFDGAENTTPAQEIEIDEEDWDEKTGTASIGLRFVRFQKVTSLIIFVADGDGESDKTRVDRIRFIGESGEKRELGKLEKIGDEAGE